MWQLIARVPIEALGVGQTVCIAFSGTRDGVHWKKGWNEAIYMSEALTTISCA
jgi:hypothetical protein